MLNVYVVVYRVGGWANFEWCKTLGVLTMAEAEKLLAEVVRGGRPAFIAPLNVPVPTTFNPS